MIKFYRNQSSESGDINMLLVLVIFFALGSVGFGIFAVTSSIKARTAMATLAQQKAEEYERGKSEQREIDTKEFIQANNSPYRAYTAPSLYGSFIIKFPKAWSGYVTENLSAETQINLFLHPEFVKSGSTGQPDGNYAAHIQLKRQTLEAAEKAIVRNGSVKLKKTNVTVSGIASVQYEGKYEQKREGVVVLVPIRDKTLMISCDDAKYRDEFSQILAQSNLLP